MAADVEMGLGVERVLALEMEMERVLALEMGPVRTVCQRPTAPYFGQCTTQGYNRFA